MVNSAIEEAICKHWAVAGAMRGIVSLWELYAGSLFPNGYCYIPSLQNVRCCNFKGGVTDYKDFHERVWNPYCCHVTEKCCQPPDPGLPDLFKSNKNDTLILYDVPNLSDNPHPEYFLEEKENYSTVDIVIIILFGGAFVTVMVICATTLYFNLRKRKSTSQFLQLQPT
jgi:hypothetical protein